MKKLILITMLALPMASYCGCKFTTPALDGHSIMHYAGARFVYNVIEGATGSPVWSHIICTVLFLGYEIYVDGYNNPYFGIQPDPRGADLAGDGVLMMLGMRDQYNINRKVRLQLSIKKDLYILGLQIKILKNRGIK